MGAQLLTYGIIHNTLFQLVKSQSFFRSLMAKHLVSIIIEQDFVFSKGIDRIIG